MAQLSAYLQRSQHSVYYFRIRVPESARKLVPQSQIRRSLRTKCKRQAIVRSAKLLQQVEGLFHEAVKGQPVDLSQLSWSDQSEPSPVAAVPTSALDQAPAPARTSPKISVALAQYLEAQHLEGVGAKTIGDKRSIVELLVRAVGDMPVHRFQRQHAQQFREIALKLPPRSNRKHHVPLERLIADAESTISMTTFNNYVKYLSAFFAWLVLEGHCDKNPFEGLRIKQRARASAGRSRFTEGDLQRLFSGICTRHDPGKPYQYWLPLLALYTGARMGELCQLYADDIVTINGIDCIYIREGRADQRLKTPSSERVIPIHSQLRDVGFMQYVQGRKQQGADALLFDLIRHQRHGYSATPSKWFGRLREALGFKGAESKKDFHSFRHTVADHLKQLGVTESLVAGVLGHQSGGITFSRYGKDFKPEVLQPVIEQLAFGIEIACPRSVSHG